MRYYKVADGTTPNLFEIRMAHPEISIPAAGGDLSSLGYETLAEAAKPEALPGHRVIEGPVLEVGGVWTSSWLQELLDGTEIMTAIVSATQARLDNFAKTRNYDGILSACTYATSSMPKFLAEGQYCVDARDATWATLYSILADVQAGTRTMPLSFADVEGELPALAWPA